MTKPTPVVGPYDLIDHRKHEPPTQAQIEAAAKVINEIYDEGQPPGKVVLETAKDALTAAAEVGGIYHLPVGTFYPEKLHKELVAAAKAEMKERCAQVAERYGTGNCAVVAAAIRALKEKT